MMRREEGEGGFGEDGAEGGRHEQVGGREDVERLRRLPAGMVEESVKVWHDRRRAGHPPPSF